MDEDLAGILILIGLLAAFAGLAFGITYSIFFCIVTSRVRKWKKEKAARASNNTDVEREGLVGEDEEELEILDSDDEADYRARQAELETDWDLTPRQKFKKEWKRVWSGADAKEAYAKKEREDRQKIAKAVAKEVARLERRRERRERNGGPSSQPVVQDEAQDGLPSYSKAVNPDDDVKR